MAPPGSSAHNFGAAYDIAIFDQGSYIEHGSDWRYQLSGRVGRDLLHLEWGGDWTTDPDFPHFQLPSWRQAPNLQLYTGP